MPSPRSGQLSVAADADHLLAVPPAEVVKGVVARDAGDAGDRAAGAGSGGVSGGWLSASSQSQSLRQRLAEDAALLFARRACPPSRTSFDRVLARHWSLGQPSEDAAVAARRRQVAKAIAGPAGEVDEGKLRALRRAASSCSDRSIHSRPSRRRHDRVQRTIGRLASTEAAERPGDGRADRVQLLLRQQIERAVRPVRF